MEELLQYCSMMTGYEKEEVESIVNAFLEKIVEELSEGNAVDLGKDFGIFTVKLRTSNLQENSPRTPKDARYRTIFRENSGMKKRLKVSSKR